MNNRKKREADEALRRLQEEHLEKHLKARKLLEKRLQKKYFKKEEEP